MRTQSEKRGIMRRLKRLRCGLVGLLVIYIGTTIGVVNEVRSAEETSTTHAGERHTFRATRFGVPINVQLYAADESTAKKAAEAAFEEARRLDRIFSDYDPDSESRLLTETPPGEFVAVSRELGALLLRSRDLHRQTAGAFDVSVGPLTHLWRKSRRLKRLPRSQDLQEAKRTVGLVTEILHRETSPNDRGAAPDGHQLEFALPAPGMRLDFGGIAKGYAIDCMSDVIRSHGVSVFLVDAGGDIYAAGRPPGTAGWRVAIESRDTTDVAVLTLTDLAVATSGDTYQYVEINGQRYSHIIDPRTKEPLISQPQVTVVAENATEADALASALSVLGIDDGLEFVKRQQTRLSGTLPTVRFEANEEEMISAGWRNLTRPAKAPAAPPIRNNVGA